MTPDHPLSVLIESCEIRVGAYKNNSLEVFDFSPIQIAAFIEGQEVISDSQATETLLREQISQLGRDHGSKSAGGGGITSLGVLSGSVTGQEVDAMVEELNFNLTEALKLLMQSDAVRWRPDQPENNSGDPQR